MILLYSFEGTTFRYSDNSYKDTPVPMSNTEVKLVNAESTWLEAIWEDRKLLNKISISYEVLFLLCISSQIASGLACYVREHKLNFRNREMLEKRKTHPFEKIGVSLVCMRWTLVNSVTGCKRLRLASDLPAVKQQAGWNRLRFTKWGRKYLPGTAWEGTASRGFHPPEAVRFQTILWTI